MPAVWEQLRELVDYIELNRQNPLSLRDLQQHSGLSAYQIMRLFERHTGLSPMAYVRARRLAGSLPQLLRGDTILAVALDWGFEYEQSYIRAFRCAFGQTPARFRRRGGAARIVAVPQPVGLTVSAKGMQGQPSMVVQPSFTVRGAIHRYDYQDNLLKAAPLVENLCGGDDPVYWGACRPARERRAHEYLVRDGAGGALWSYPAGVWARFEYSGPHALDPQGAQRIRLLLSLVVGNWFIERGMRWDGHFIETVERCRCSDAHCEITVMCYVSGLEEGQAVGMVS